MSGAKTLFDTYASGGLSHLQSLVGNEIETGLQDFKLFLSSNPTNWGRDDKKALSEGLSGFANSEGGLLIWGVDCRKGPDGADIVQELKPIQQLKAVLAQMLTLSASLVSPAVIGAEHIPIYADKPEDTGFIITYVPKGESSPHMAMVGNRFMYRAGNSFLPMPEWMVADRYGKRPQPKLKLALRDMGGQYVGINIVNEGLGTAINPGYELHRTSTFRPGKFTAHDHNRRMSIYNTTHSCSGQAHGTVIIHPGRSIDIGSVETLDPVTLDVEYELFCDGFYDRGVITIPHRSGR